MPMEWTEVVYPLAGGMDEKFHDFVVEAPRIDLALNAWIDKAGSIRRRFGLLPIYPTNILTTSGLVAAGTDYKQYGMAMHGSAPVAFTSSDATAFGATGRRAIALGGLAGTWSDRGMAISGQVLTRGVAKDDEGDVGACDRAETGSTVVHAWGVAEGSSLGIYVQATDADTGSVLMRPRRICTDGRYPRAVACAGRIYVVYKNFSTDDIETLVINPTNATTFASSFLAAPAVTASDTNAATVFDATCNTTYGPLLAYLNASGRIAYGFINTSGVVGSLGDTVPATTPIRIACHANGDDGALHGIAYCDGAAATDVYALLRSWNGATWTSTATSGAIESGMATGALQIACRWDDATTFRIWWSGNGVTPAAGYMTTRVAQSTYTVGGVATPAAAATTLRRAMLASRPFITPNGPAVWALLSEVPGGTAGVQDQLVLVDQAFQPMAVTLIGQGGTGAGFFLGQLPHVTVGADGGYAFDTNYEARAVASTSTGVTGVGTFGVREVYGNFLFQDHYHTVQIGESLYLAGGMLMEFDGVSFVESGFLRITEPDTFTVATDAAGALTPGDTHSYIFIPEWTNAKGERSLGTCAGALTQEVPVGVGSLIFAIPTITCTLKKSPRPDIVFGVYRTDANPSGASPHYRIGQVANDPTADAVTFTDNGALDSGDGLEELYSNAEIENTTPTPGHIVCSGAGRVFMAGLDDGNEIRPSKVYSPGRSLEFSDAIRIMAPADGGRITALAFMDDSLIVFKERRIYRVRGSGPDNSIRPAGSFTEPELITSDAGALTHAGVVVTPLGVMFASKKGIFLLDRSHQLSYIGAPVEDRYGDLVENSDIVGPTRSALMTQDQHVYFGFGAEGTLVFDYFHKQWFIWLYAGTSAPGPGTVYGDNFAFALDGEAMRTDHDAEEDDGTPFTMTLRTGWLKAPTGYQGNMRVRRFGVFGDVLGSCTLNVSVYQDFVESSVQSESQAFVSAQKLDEEWRSDNQICESVRLSIDDGSAAGAGLRLHAITYEIGIKKGFRR
jgi:hypothetical protein